ncbi:MAG TPA: hypothetical protein VIV60_07365 [Polyangiaceae bacterium]
MARTDCDVGGSGIAWCEAGPPEAAVREFGRVLDTCDMAYFGRFTVIDVID